MRFVVGLAFLALVTSLFLASMAFATVALFARAILFGAEAVWLAFVGMARRGVAAVLFAFLPPAALIAGLIWLWR